MCLFCRLYHWTGADRKTFTGALHLPRYLTLDARRALAAECQALLDGAVPAYVPTVRGGGKIHVRMLCLGRHWNGQTYRYEAARSDFDGLPAACRRSSRTPRRPNSRSMAAST